eukprot:CAMPEP_0170566210 /NCGR_PEP_ID=MMETSP0211-20121228/79691_1 /TAXON_ID=311385 /ORGANISM="Pseudokeronopsis sp., Strain OXSARD2" /LENGTH=47 /DNA_ID= /DNA_START= /DNA_END= /DNA_ORIENTATION=
MQTNAKDVHQVPFQQVVDLYHKEHKEVNEYVLIDLRDEELFNQLHIK